MKIPSAHIAKNYYAPLPELQHRTGDIWRNLSAFGLIHSQNPVSGLVITPACDLANNKTPTITYLPIVSVRTYLSTENGYSLMRSTMSTLLEGQLKRSDLSELLERSKIPDETTLALMEEEIKKNASGHSSIILKRLNAGLSAIRKIRSGDSSAGSEIKIVLKTDDWKQFCENIVKNAIFDDVHFLPPEEPIEEWSAISEPSLVLFRYPITVPRAMLDMASSSHEDWPTNLQKLSPFHQLGFKERPLKVTRLSKEFLSDLLTRFARLYVRIGAPDFSREAVISLAEKVEGACRS